MRLSRWIAARSSWRLLLILFVAFGLAYWLFFLSTAPFAITSVRFASGGLDILDIGGFYTPAQAYSRVLNLGIPGRAAYWWVLAFDVLYPLIYGAFFAVAISLAARGAGGGWWTALNLVPIAAALADYLENLAIALMLLLFPLRLDPIGLVAGLLTPIKSLLFLLSVLVLLVVTIVALVRVVVLRLIRRPAR